MDLNKKLKELKPQQLNCNVFDVYSYNGLTMQDLLCQFFTTINECVKSTNEVIDLTDWLVNIGLEEEVVKKLMVLIEDGTVEELINVNLFENLNKQLEQKANSINVYDKSNTYNKNEVDTKVFTMANMGQDVKEAMTGGSVAVVGENAILSENIVDRQITFNKMGCRYLEGIIKQGNVNLDIVNKKIIATGPAGVYVDVHSKYYTYQAHEVDINDININTICGIYFNLTTLRYEMYSLEKKITEGYNLVLIAYYWKNRLTSRQDKNVLMLNGSYVDKNREFDFNSDPSSNYRCGMVNGYMNIDTTTRTITYKAFNAVVPLPNGPHIPGGECVYPETTEAINIYVDMNNKSLACYKFTDTTQNSITNQFFLGTLFNNKMHNSLSNKFITVNGIKDGGWYEEINTNERITTLNEVWNNWERGCKYPIAFLGDSTTDGHSTTTGANNVIGTDYINEHAYPYLLEQLIKTETNNDNVRIYNAGFSGQTAQWAKNNIETIFTNYRDSKMVGISYGINDSLTDDVGVYYDSFKSNIEWLITYFKGKGIQPFLLTTQAVLMKKGSRNQTTSDKINTVANKIKEELAIKHNLEIIDVNKFTEMFLLYSNYNINEIEPDSLHFGDIGHKYESELFFSILCPRVINTSNIDKITIFTQNVKTDINNFTKNTNSEFKYVVNYTREETSDLLVLDVLLFNNEKTQIKLSVVGDVLVKDNGELIDDLSQYDLDLGLHHIQVVSQSNKVSFEGIKIIRN